MPKILRKTESWQGKNKNRKAGLDQKLRIVLSLIWPEIKNYEAEPIWGILIKKEGVYIIRVILNTEFDTL